MRRRLLRAACCVLLLGAIGCSREVAPPRVNAPAEVVEVDYDKDNLLNLAHGASVLSRSAELSLMNSAVHAIDGDWQTLWKSPPGGAEQTLVLSLAARARISRVGILSVKIANEAPDQVKFAASDDGTSWREVVTMNVKPSGDPQYLDVPPFDASYLRVQTIANHYYSTFLSVFAFGRELAPPVQPKIEGCWTINGEPARFIQRGNSVAGVIGRGEASLVSGSTDGRIIRLMWRQGAMWGHAIVTVDPRRRTLSGERWHEIVRMQNSGYGWFGEPAQCNGAVDFNENSIAAAILQRAGHWKLFADSAIDTASALMKAAPQVRFRIIARDAARRDAVQRALQARGADMSRIEFAIVAATP